MIKRKHLRIVRAVQRVVAASKELADAERALERPRQQARREKVASGVGDTSQGVHHG